MVVLSMSLLFGNAVYAQITTENGIHVSGGSFSAQKVSSNIGNTTVATGYNSFAQRLCFRGSNTKTLLSKKVSMWHITM